MALAEILQQSFFTYGPLVLLPLLMMEGPLMAIAGGFLVATKSISFWMLYVTYLIADLLVTHMYYFAGSSSKKVFVRIRNHFVKEDHINSRRSRLVSFLKEKLITNYPIVFTTTKFVPIPYSTTTATILSGMLGIPYRKMMSYVLWIAPIQGLIYIGIGYGLADGILNELTQVRLLTLSLLTVIIGLVINYRHTVWQRILHYTNN